MARLSTGKASVDPLAVARPARAARTAHSDGAGAAGSGGEESKAMMTAACGLTATRQYRFCALRRTDESDPGYL